MVRRQGRSRRRTGDLLGLCLRRINFGFEFRDLRLRFTVRRLRFPSGGEAGFGSNQPRLAWSGGLPLAHFFEEGSCVIEPGQVRFGADNRGVMRSVVTAGGSGRGRFFFWGSSSAAGHAGSSTTPSLEHARDFRHLGRRCRPSSALLDHTLVVGVRGG